MTHSRKLKAAFIIGILEPLIALRIIVRFTYGPCSIWEFFAGLAAEIPTFRIDTWIWFLPMVLVPLISCIYIALTDGEIWHMLLIPPAMGFVSTFICGIISAIVYGIMYNLGELLFGLVFLGFVSTLAAPAIGLIAVFFGGFL